MTDGGEVYSAGIYARLSVDCCSKKSESVENQIAIAEAFLKEHPEITLFDRYVDLGKSGTHFDRKEFIRLMQDVKLRKVDCILVKDFSRFGRNYIETGDYIQKIFPFLGVRFISVADSFDSLYSQADEISVNLLNLTNEMYARDIALKVKSSRRLSKEMGNYTGGRAPYGYKIGFFCGKRRLFIDREAAEVVEKLFDMCGEGRSPGEMRRWLYEEKIHSPAEYGRYGHVRAGQGEEILEWSYGSLRALLTNPVYMGGNAAEGRGEAGEKSCEAILSKERFTEAAKALEERRHRGGEKRMIRSREVCDVFEGILYCGDCGKRMARKGDLRRNASGEEIGNYGYFCRGSLRLDGRCCKRKYVGGKRLKALAGTAIGMALSLEGRTAEDLRRQAAEVLERIEKVQSAEEERMERCRAALQRHNSELYQKYRSGRMSREDYAHQSGEIQKRRKRIEAELEEENRGRKSRAAFLKRWEEHNDLEEAYGDMAGALIEKICIYGDKRIEIVFRFRRKKPQQGVAAYSPYKCL